jgi:ferredoxin
MRINADENRCVGAGQCVLAAPSVFDQSDEDGTVVLLSDRVDDAHADAIREAVTLCPSGALSLVDDE